jgi:hypothetical protein
MFNNISVEDAASISYTEERDDIFFRNVSKLLIDYASHSKRE